MHITAGAALLLQNAGNLQWQYPINNRLSSQYNASTSQSLFMFAYLVMVHNRHAQFGNPDPVILNPKGFDVILPINCTYIYTNINVAWFFYSSTLNMAIMSFTGTYNNILALVDVEYRQVIPKDLHNYVDGMFAHGGFYDLYARVQQPLLTVLNQYINKDTQVVITGISLGAAMSTLCALDLHGRQLTNGTTITNPIHYNFAGPRVLNNVAATIYDKIGLDSFRVINLSDIIPTVPAPIMMAYTGAFDDFHHVGQLIYFDDNLEDYYANHITAYVEYYDAR